jgi:hypothetical protein
MRLYAKLFMVALTVTGSFVAAPDAQAWHRHGCGLGSSYLSTWGAYGMGGGFRHSGFSSFYSSSFTSFYQPSYVSCYRPSFVSCYRPIICAPRLRCVDYVPDCWSAPTYVNSYYSCPTYTLPACYSSWSYSSYYPAYSYGSYNNCYSSYSPAFVPFPSLVNSHPHVAALQSRLASNQPRQNGLGVGSVLLPKKELPVATGQTRLVSLNQASNAPKFPLTEPAAQPNESWVVLAVEMIDSMAKQGGVSEGLASAEQLIRVKQGLPSEVYWRAAILASLAGRDSKQVSQYIDLAERAPGRFSPSLLPGGSLRGYVKRIPGQTLDKALDRHARTALTESRPTEAYRILATFLHQDGQSQRAEKFAIAGKKALPKASNTEKDAVLLTSAEASVESR